jgi:hypothetical protein
MGMMRKTASAAGRRAFLVRGAGMSVAGIWPLLLADPPVRIIRHGRVGGIGGAAVPPRRINLADYGGTPGAGRATLVDAFNRAFADLEVSGGGTLLIPAGVYDFGSYTEATDIILCRNLRNIAISAYGATFTVTTAARTVPNFFYFFNFHNITIAGASFIDQGFSPWLNWRGMYCVGIQADQASSGFRMVDCYAERVVGLLASNNNAAGRMLMSDVSVQGEVRYAYYGVGASFIREKVKVDLVCHNVRRAFIAYSLKNADITVKVNCTSDWPGSNGLVALVSGGASMGNVDDVRVRVDVSGECIHSGYVHFYHQGPEIAGHMRNIDATVNVINAKSVRNLFVFDHETDGVQSRTARVWDRIALHGALAGKFAGKVISNASVSTSPGTVYLDSNLAKVARMNALAAGFRVRPPGSPGASP